MIKLHEAIRVRGMEGNYRGWHLGYWERILHCKCDECGVEFIDKVNTDPGSVEEAIGVRTLCTPCWDNPEVEYL